VKEGNDTVGADSQNQSAPTTRRRLLGMGAVSAVVATAGVVGRSEVASAQAMSFTFLLPPQRAYDSRESEEPIKSGGVVTVSLSEIGVPEAAKGVLLNVTVVNTVAAGYLVVVPASSPLVSPPPPPPPISNINWYASRQIVANSVTSALSGAASRMSR
jgi:hypothetical protein